MKNPFLIGKKIYLSPLTKEDISDEYINWLNDSEVCRGNSHATYPNNYAKTLSYIESISDSHKELAFTVRLKSNDLHIGNASLQHLNWVHKYGNLAILIGNKKYWNKGISTEILQLLIRYGFRTLNLNRISAKTQITNKGGIRICEKNGLKKEGILRELLFKDGKYIDVIIFSILQREYDKEINFTGK